MKTCAYCDIEIPDTVHNKKYCSKSCGDKFRLRASDKVSNTRKAYYENNKDRIKEWRKEHRANNKDTINARNRENYKINGHVKKAKDKRWRDNNKDKVRGYKLKHRYGMSLSDYNELEKSQNGCCVICNKSTKLYVDHCHNSDEIRGLLCRKCNLGIGYLKDSITNLRNAIEYLEKADAKIQQKKSR